MLASIIQSVYIDPEWVANGYLKRYKPGSWKKDDTVEALKCWNLEHILKAKSLVHAKPNALTLDQLISKTEEAMASISIGEELITVGD